MDAVVMFPANIKFCRRFRRCASPVADLTCTIRWSLLFRMCASPVAGCVPPHRWCYRACSSFFKANKRSLQSGGLQRKRRYMLAMRLVLVIVLSLLGRKSLPPSAAVCLHFRSELHALHPAKGSARLHEVRTKKRLKRDA